MDEDCIFCKIISKKIPAYIIYENDDVTAFLDAANDVEGHTLVVPKRHYESLLDCPNDVINKVMGAVRYISNYYIDKCGYSGVNIINNSGDDAHQSIFHFHVHIYPRKYNDGHDLTVKTKGTNANHKDVHARLRIK